MKKLLFSVIVFAAFAGISLQGANKKAVIADGNPCNYKISVWKDGKRVDYMTKSGLENMEDCAKMLARDVAYYKDHYPEKEGFTVSFSQW